MGGKAHRKRVCTIRHSAWAGRVAVFVDVSVAAFVARKQGGVVLPGFGQAAPVDAAGRGGEGDGLEQVLHAAADAVARGLAYSSQTL